MATPRPRPGLSASLRGSDDHRLTESEKIEGAGSWDALEWTKIEPVSRSVPEGLLGFLLEAEQVIVEYNEASEQLWNKFEVQIITVILQKLVLS
ncbi:Phosphoric monoester hydrolase [Sarracenia purpurea var. burkii]